MSQVRPRSEPPRIQPEATRSELREQAMIRDGGRCVWCQVLGFDKDLSDIKECAHLRGIGAGGRKSGDTLANQATLCRPHHDLLDGRQLSGRREALAGLLAYIVRTRRPAYPTDPAVPVE